MTNPKRFFCHHAALRFGSCRCFSRRHHSHDSHPPQSMVTSRPVRISSRLPLRLSSTLHLFPANDPDRRGEDTKLTNQEAEAYTVAITVIWHLAVQERCASSFAITVVISLASHHCQRSFCNADNCKLIKLLQLPCTAPEFAELCPGRRITAATSGRLRWTSTKRKTRRRQRQRLLLPLPLPRCCRLPWEALARFRRRRCRRRPPRQHLHRLLRIQTSSKTSTEEKARLHTPLGAPKRYNSRRGRWGSPARGGTPRS
jgi:hypothetical protein